MARRLPLSVSATGERLRTLRRSGVIRRFTAELDLAAIGRPIEAFVEVRFAAGVGQAEIDRAIDGLAMVTDALHLTGRYDVMLRVATADVAELDRLLIELKEDGLAEETNTRLILRTMDGFPRAPEPVD